MDKAFNYWTEVKTAWKVAELGTLSAAGNALGVHRATVQRHVDALEDALGIKLFQRHARGYEPTDAGKELINVASLVDEQLTQWQGSIQRQAMEFTGELVITGLEVISPFLVPAINAFRHQHPKVIIRYLASAEIFKLQYGTAHIAFRTGPKPQDPDYIVQPYCNLPIGLFAHQSYIARHGLPKLPEEASAHTFVGPENITGPVPFFHWLNSNVPRECVTVRSGSQMVMAEAVRQGAGIGFLLRYEATGNSELVEVHPPSNDWQVPIWLLTHVDLHRSAKVQAFLKLLKDKSCHLEHFSPISTLRD